MSMKDQVPHIEAEISAQGIKQEAHGFKGGACVKATEEIEAAMGGTTTTKERVLKASFYQRAVSAAQNILKGGANGRG